MKITYHLYYLSQKPDISSYNGIVSLCMSGYVVFGEALGVFDSEEEALIKLEEIIKGTNLFYTIIKVYRNETITDCTII